MTFSKPPAMVDSEAPLPIWFCWPPPITVPPAFVSITFPNPPEMTALVVPSDTVFLRAKNGDFDAVLTMYHDQGQIAMKLIGFDRGVTLIGGFPFPICTPAHGTAYEIAGKGIANLGATRAALHLAISMAKDGKARKAAA